MLTIGRTVAGFAAALIFIPIGWAAEGEQANDLKDQAALAEKQVAIKRALVKVADVKKSNAEAKLKLLKSKVTTAEAAAATAKAKLEGVKDLRAKAVISEGEL